MIINKKWQLNVVAAGTALLGVLTLGSTLYGLVHLHRARIVLADAHLTVIAGVSLIYLATLLRRGKRNAWLLCLVIYSLLLLRNLRHFVFDDDLTAHYLLLASTSIVLPLLLLAGLVLFRRQYQVKSEPTTFRVAFIRTLIVLAITFLYGFIGFQLFNKHDFRYEISAPQAAHYTIDQLGLTTNDRPQAYTKRSVLFVDSLATVSVVSLVYVGVAFFAPVRFRLSHHREDYELAAQIIRSRSETSEDFFKLWPQDKTYMFSQDRSAVLAYKVAGGAALVVGDPLGPTTAINSLLDHFLELCRINDWSPAFIHANESNINRYKKAGLELQKIGEEALVDIQNFKTNVLGNKYFRNIQNRFTKQGFSFEILEPPHSPELIAELKIISDNWLEGPGREERGFMMGYFDSAYLNLCNIAIAKDASGKILAFINQVPTVKESEANFDFLRSSRESPSNINDFLMISFIEYLDGLGYQKINMGLSPLVGLDDLSKKSVVDSIFGFVYQYANRFYSFQGLARFKSKYEPTWEDRYIVYSGGVPGLAKILNALLKAMAVSSKPKVGKH